MFLCKQLKSTCAQLIAREIQPQRRSSPSKLQDDQKVITRSHTSVCCKRENHITILNQSNCFRHYTEYYTKLETKSHKQSTMLLVVETNCRSLSLAPWLKFTIPLHRELATFHRQVMYLCYFSLNWNLGAISLMDFPHPSFFLSISVKNREKSSPSSNAKGLVLPLEQSCEQNMGE